MPCPKLEKIEMLDVEIVKMNESSGNEQFYVNLSRNDGTSSRLSHMEKMTLACFQTKKNGHVMDKDECLALAWFEAGRLARFVGLKSLDDIKLVGISEEEKKVLFASITLFH